MGRTATHRVHDHVRRARNASTLYEPRTPERIRYLLAYDHGRCIAVLRIFVRALLSFYRHRAPCARRLSANALLGPGQARRN
jgi:hypothetical protein